MQSPRTTAERAWDFGSRLLLEGMRRGVTHRAVAELERLTRDPSVDGEAQAVYRQILDMNATAIRLEVSS